MYFIMFHEEKSDEKYLREREVKNGQINSTGSCQKCAVEITDATP